MTDRDSSNSSTRALSQNIGDNERFNHRVRFSSWNELCLRVASCRTKAWAVPDVRSEVWVSGRGRGYRRSLHVLRPTGDHILDGFVLLIRSRDRSTLGGMVHGQANRAPDAPVTSITWRRCMPNGDGGRSSRQDGNCLRAATGMLCPLSSAAVCRQ